MIPILNMADAQALKARVMNRSQLQNEEVSKRVKEIVARVREEGDAALFEYTARFDKAEINASNVLVTREEIDKAYEAASDNSCFFNISAINDGFYLICIRDSP